MCLFNLKLLFSLFISFNCNIILYIFEIMSNIYYITKQTLTILLKHIHTHTLLYYKFNYQIFTLHSPHTHFQNNSKQTQNTYFPTYFLVTKHTVNISVYLHYIDYDYTSHTPSFLQQPRTDITYTHIYLLRLNQLLIAQTNYLTCNPKSLISIFNE
jgi:hypothetical protein